jgi:hypothetical protein
MPNATRVPTLPGHMTILKGEPEVSVTFDGLTADERFEVSFFTFGAKRLPD